MSETPVVPLNVSVLLARGSMPADQTKPTSIQIAVWGILTAGIVFLSLWHYQLYQFGAHVDDASYMILARSLVTSDQYGMIQNPGNPVPGKYPFVYPLLLVPSIVAAPNNLDALKLPSLLATCANVLLLFWGWRYFSKTTSYWWGIAIAALYGLAPLTIDHSRQVMSEPFFALFCLLAIALAEQMVRRAPTRACSLALSIVLVLAMYTRSVGLILVISVLVYLLIVNGGGFWKQVAVIAIQAAVFLAFVLLLTPVQDRDLLPLEYLKDENSRLFGTPLTMEGNADIASKVEAPPNNEPAPTVLEQRLVATRDLIYLGITRHIGPDIRAIALPIGGGEKEQELANILNFPALTVLSDYLVALVVFGGFLRALSLEKQSLFLIFGIVYFVALLFWFWKESRLLYPIQPQILFSLLMGIQGGLIWLASKMTNLAWRGRVRNAVFLFCVLGVMAGFVFKSIRIQDSRLYTGDVALRSIWLKQQSPSSAIVMTEYPEPDFAYSGRKTVPFPNPALSTTDLETYLTQKDITYILLAPPIEWQSSYTPYYTDATNEIKTLVEQLELDHTVIQVFDSGPGLLKVYQVQALAQ